MSLPEQRARDSLASQAERRRSAIRHADERLPGAVERLAQASRDPAITETESPPGLLRREAIYRRMLALADVCSASLSLVPSVSIVGDDAIQPSLLLGLPVVVAL